MVFIKLADIIRKYNDCNIDLLINNIELLECRQDIETVGDLTNYLENELQYWFS